MCNGVSDCRCEGLWDIYSDSIHVNPFLCGAGYHDGFITSILITEVPYNPIVYLGECMAVRGEHVSAQEELLK